MDEKNRTILRTPKIDFKRIHPMILAMIPGKSTQSKVSLYFHDVIFWLESARLSLSSYKNSSDKLNNEEFVEGLKKEMKLYDYCDELIFFLENVVIRLSAIRDKLAITALVYYSHPSHLGGCKFEIRGCKCGNQGYLEALNEENCNFGVLMRFLKQENVTDSLFAELQKIQKDNDIGWIVSQRNIISHRISQYRWFNLGIIPNGLDIKKEEGKEVSIFSPGVQGCTLMEDVPRMETVYNRFVEYVEDLEPILFPLSSNQSTKQVS